MQMSSTQAADKIAKMTEDRFVLPAFNKSTSTRSVYKSIVLKYIQKHKGVELADLAIKEHLLENIEGKEISKKTYSLKKTGLRQFLIDYIETNDDIAPGLKKGYTDEIETGIDS